MSSLRQLVQSLKVSVEKLESELEHIESPLPKVWGADQTTKLDDLNYLPSWSLFEAVSKIRLDSRALEAAVTPAHLKLLDFGLRPIIAGLVHVVAELGVSDAIEALGGSASLPDLAGKLSVNEHKLGRVLRTLSAEFLFEETSIGVFRNSRHSKALTSHAADFISLLSHEGLRSSSGLYQNLTDPITKDGFTSTDAPFCHTVAKNGQTFVEYVMLPENSAVAGKAMNSALHWLNRITRPALLNDYPWDEHSDARVIDVGCGPGDSGIDVLRKYPNLHWVFQDLSDVIGQTQKALPDDIKEKIATGQVKCIAQDYFEANESDGDIWYLRGVIREYDDADALRVLRQIATAMSKKANSKMIINEITTTSSAIAPGSDNSTIVPSETVPRDQSRLADLANLMTWNTYSFFGGKERSFNEYEELLSQAGLRVTRFFPFRSFTSMIECELE